MSKEKIRIIALFIIAIGSGVATYTLFMRLGHSDSFGITLLQIIGFMVSLLFCGTSLNLLEKWTTGKK